MTSVRPLALAVVSAEDEGEGNEYPLETIQQQWGVYGGPTWGGLQAGFIESVGNTK